MPIVEQTCETDLDLPVEERLIPVHVPAYIERYALRIADRHGGDVEQWVMRCLAFNVRPLLRHCRPEGARTYAVHASVDAEIFAAVQASGNPEQFVREAIREKVERSRLANHVSTVDSVSTGP